MAQSKEEVKEVLADDKEEVAIEHKLKGSNWKQFMVHKLPTNIQTQGKPKIEFKALFIWFLSCASLVKEPLGAIVLL